MKNYISNAINKYRFEQLETKIRCSSLTKEQKEEFLAFIASDEFSFTRGSMGFIKDNFVIDAEAVDRSVKETFNYYVNLFSTKTEEEIAALLERDGF